MTLAAILLLNFIIASMTNAFATTEKEVDVWVHFHRIKWCRDHDRKLPSIPAPFQIVIWMLKQIWFLIIEPVLYLLTGHFVNEQRLISNTEHLAALYRKHPFLRSNRPRAWLRRPFFVDFNDQIHGDLGRPPSTFCGRLLWLRLAVKEAKSGQLFVFEGNQCVQQSGPSIWKCGYWLPS